MPRPYMDRNIEELEGLVDKHEEERETLLDEIRRRTTPGARNLRERLDPPPPKLDSSVYVIELDPAVLNDRMFRERNPDHDPESEYSCLYVGKTTKSPEERFEVHMGGGIHAARLATKFGQRLRPEFYQRLNPMTRTAAEREEEELACMLQKVGYAVWWN